MNLFKSKFSKLEAFVNTKADERTADMLAAAQTELDTAGAGLILVSKTDTIKTGDDLQSHLDGLQSSANTAKAEAEKAQKALTDLKGSRAMDDHRKESDKGDGGDGNDKSAEEKAAAAIINDPDAKWNAMADRMGY